MQALGNLWVHRLSRTCSVISVPSAQDSHQPTLQDYIVSSEFRPSTRHDFNRLMQKAQYDWLIAPSKDSDGQNEFEIKKCKKLNILSLKKSIERTALIEIMQVSLTCQKLKKFSCAKKVPRVYLFNSQHETFFFCRSWTLEARKRQDWWKFRRALWNPVQLS